MRDNAVDISATPSLLGPSVAEPLRPLTARSLSSSDVLILLDEVERRYGACWNVLASFRNGDPASPETAWFTKFQGDLAYALFGLSNLHSRAAKEKKRLIGRKNRYKPSWFRARMARLDKLQKLAVSAISIGRNLGDAYAWIFLQDDREVLQRHGQEQSQMTMSTGVGGMGELLFACNVALIDGYLVIHHCVTSTLKLGDITLIDVSTLKIAGIGELKSHEISPGEIDVQAHVRLTTDVSDTKVQAEDAQKRPAGESSSGLRLNAAATQRLTRQMRRVTSSLLGLSTEPEKKMDMDIPSRYAYLASTIRHANQNRITAVSCGGGLMYAAYETSARSLARRLWAGVRSSRPRRTPNMEEVVPGAAKLLLPNRLDNALSVDTLFYDASDQSFRHPGMTHPFWWPIPADLMRRVIFREVEVIAVYNPAHLFAALEENHGVVEGRFPGEIKVKFERDGKVFVVEGLSHYIRSIQAGFLDEGTVAKMIVDVIDAAPDRERGAIEMIIHQRYR